MKKQDVGRSDKLLLFCPFCGEELKWSAGQDYHVSDYSYDYYWLFSCGCCKESETMRLESL